MKKQGIWILAVANLVTLGCGGRITTGISRLAYRPNGDLVAFSASIDIYDADLRKQASIPNPAGSHDYRQFDLSADGTVAIVVDYGATANVFRVPGGEPIASFMRPGLGSVEMGTALSPHGELVFANETQVSPATDQGPAQVNVFGVRAADGTPLWTLPGRLNSPGFSPDGAVVFGLNQDFATAGSPNFLDSRLEVFDAATGALRFAVNAGGRLSNVALGPGGQTLVGVLDTCVSRGCWEYLAAWSLTEGSLLSKVAVPEGVGLSGGAPMMSCASTEAVCASHFYDGAVEGISVWQPDGTFLRSITRKAPWRVWPVVSPDGRFVAVTGDDASVYRVDDGSSVGPLRSRDGIARSAP